MVKMAKRYMLRDKVSKEDREFMQRLYRRAAKPKEQLDIICDLFPYHTKKQIKVVLGLERETKAPEKQKEYNEMRRSYDQATKDAVVKDVLLYGISQPQVSEKYGIPISNINRWVTKAIKQRQDIEDYADKIEREITAEKQDAATEGYNFDWQRLEKESAEWNVEKKLTSEKAAEQDAAPEEEKTFPYSHFIPLAKCEPGAAEQCRAEEQSQPVYEYVEEDSKSATDEKAIKAAAYDVITNQMREYPCSSTDTMMRFIQGVQALAQQLCGEVE